MLIEIFKAGTHTDSAGNTRTWTEKDLDAIAGKYNPAEHEAPVVIGHPKDNAPAYGWVEAVERKGSSLYARLKDLAPEFTDWVKKGLYKKRSVSLYPDMTVRHVGFLGAVPPAVKGLADVAFQESRAVTIEFGDYRVSMVGRILQRIREFFIDKYDTETADKIIGNWEIEELQREIEEPEAELPATFNKGGQEMDKIQELEGKLREKEASFAEADRAKDAEIARLDGELKMLNAQKRKMEYETFCEGLMREGRLTPAMRPTVMDFMEILSGDGDYEFAEGGKKPVLETFKAFLNGLPKQVEFDEMATKGKAVEGKGKDTSHDFSGRVDEERLEIHQKAIDCVEKEGISYRDALHKALKEG